METFYDAIKIELEKKMKQIHFLLFVIGICLGLAVNAHAVSITAVDAAWEDTQEAWVYSKDGWDSQKDSIYWGSKNNYSYLEFETDMGSEEILLDTPFSIGSLTHYNYPIFGGFTTPSPTLDLTLSIWDPEVSDSIFDLTFEISFDIDETPNNWDREESADHISWSITDTVEATIVGVDGITYTYILEILGFGTDGEDTYTTSLTSYEYDATQTSLWAQLTRTATPSDVSPVPEPATMAMLGLGLLGLARILGKTKNR